MSTEIVSPKQHEQRPPLEAWQLQDIQFPEEYPITAVIPELRKRFHDIENNPTVMLMGEPGSGKSTAMYEAIRTLYGSTGEEVRQKNEGRKTLMTVPTKVATTNVEKRMKLFAPPGHENNISRQVGGKRSNKLTPITVATEGVLTDMAIDDPYLLVFERIILDEAHDEGVDLYQAMGLALRAQELRIQEGLPPLQVVFCSATLDKDRIDTMVGGAPLIEAEGRMHDIEDRFLTPAEKEKYMIAEGRGRKVERVFSHVNAAAHEAVNLYMTTETTHDILVFLPGMGDIEKTKRLVETLLQDHGVQDMPLVLPLAGSLPEEQQNHAAYEDTPQRKIILSTDVAETSITPTRPVHVISSGLANIPYFDEEKGMNILQTERISRRRHTQQRGRAGRNTDGICLSLMTESDVDQLPAEQQPEILRTNLAAYVLKLKAAGVPDPCQLKIPQHAAHTAYEKAIADLIRVRAITPEGEVSEDGKIMAADLPFAPELGRVILDGARNDCVEEMIAIAALTSGRSVFNRPHGKEAEANQAHARFREPGSDLLTLLNVWEAYKAEYDRTYEEEQANVKHNSRSKEKGNKQKDTARKNTDKAMRKWAHDNFVNSRVLEDVARFQRQIARRIERFTQMNQVEMLQAESGRPLSPRDRVRRSLIQSLAHEIQVPLTTDRYDNGLYTNTTTGRSDGQKINRHSACPRKATDAPVVIGTGIFKNTHGVVYIQNPHVATLEELATVLPEMVTLANTEVVNGTEQIERTTYHIRIAGRSTPHIVTADRPASPERRLAFAARELITTAREAEFNVHNRAVLQEAVREFSLRDGRPLTDADLDRMLQDWYEQTCVAQFRSDEDLMYAMHDEGADSLKATIHDFFSQEDLQRIAEQNPDKIDIEGTPTRVTYEADEDEDDNPTNNPVVAVARIDIDTALLMSIWPTHPSKSVVIDVVSHSGKLITDNIASLEVMQQRVAEYAQEEAWLTWIQKNEPTNVQSWEEAEGYQPQQYGTNQLTGEALMAYPAVLYTDGQFTVQYMRSQEDAERHTATTREQILLQRQEQAREDAWSAWHQLYGIHTFTSWEQARNCQPLTYHHEKETGTDLTAYPAVTYHEGIFTVTYTRDQQEAQRITQGTEQYYNTEVAGHELRELWSYIKQNVRVLTSTLGGSTDQDDHWYQQYEYIAGQLDRGVPISEHYHTIRSIADAIRSKLDASSLLDDLRKARRPIRHDDEDEESACQQRREQAAAISRTLTGDGDTTEQRANPHDVEQMDNQQILEYWQRMQNNMNPTQRQNALRAIALRGPHVATQAGIDADMLRSILGSLRERADSATTSDMINQRRNELQGVTLMRQILTVLTDYGITEPGDLEQFQTFLHTYIQEQHHGIYPDVAEAEKIIEAFIDSL